MQENLNKKNIYFSEIYRGLGNAQLKDGKKDMALRYYQESLKYFEAVDKAKEPISDSFSEDIDIVKCSVVELSTDFGNKAFEDKDFSKALDYFMDILNYDISNAKLFQKIAMCLVSSDAPESGLKFAKRAIELDNKNPEFYSLLAYIYGYKLSNYEKAIETFEKYLSLKTEDAFAYNSIGYMYEKIAPAKNLEKRIALFEKAIELKPDFNVAIRNLAITSQKVNDYEKAIKNYKILFDREQLPDDYFSYACMQIKLGNFEEAWKYFDARFDKKFGPTEYPKIDKPRWNGEEIKDKTLLINCEQGFGDTLQFIRFVPQLKKKVGSIIVRVQQALFDLLNGQLEDITIVGDSVAVETLNFDYHVPMMSLPAVANMRTKEDIPLASGYLTADDNKVREYKEKYFNTDKIKVGIVWHGSEQGKKDRNIPVENFKVLLKNQNIKLYSFQKDASPLQLDCFANDICNLGQTFRNFNDTAAALKNLDFLITCDNSVLHLSAGLGVKTYLLLNYFSEWRWFFDEDKTPWYDSVKILKKKEEDDSWEELIKRAKFDCN